MLLFLSSINRGVIIKQNAAIFPKVIMPTKEEVIEVLKTVEDPELFLDIWFLGLIYDVGISEEDNSVEITMTFTTPMCPAGPALIEEVKQSIMKLDGVEEVIVEITFDPPWAPSDEVKGMLGMM